MWLNLRYFLSLIDLIIMVSAQVPFLYSCYPPKLFNDFELDRYMGKWYAISTYPYTWYMGHRCLYHIYENLGDGLININTGSYFDIIDNITWSNTTAMLPEGTTSLWKLNTKMANFHSSDYMILGTDYDNWSVVFNCRNFTPFMHTEMVWLLARTTEPSPAAIQAAEQIMNLKDISLKFLMLINQTNCPRVEENPKDSFTFNNRSENVINGLRNLIVRLFRRIYFMMIGFVYGF